MKTFCHNMSKLGKRYFLLQRLLAATVGIDLWAEDDQYIIKWPLLCFIPMICCILHCLAISHFVYININDYAEVTTGMSFIFQSLLAIWKMIIFLSKRKMIVAFRREIHLLHLTASQDELSIIRSENDKDFVMSSVYTSSVCCSTVLCTLLPILNACWIYFKSGVLELNAPYKATYFWNYSHLGGYSVVYLWNCLSLYFVCFCSLTIDTLFSWLTCNILVHFRILIHRFHKTASQISAATVATTTALSDDKWKLEQITACIQYHHETLELAAKLNNVFGEIIFIKFIISCAEVCCLVFRLSHSNHSEGMMWRDGAFLSAVALQLILYCYNGQRIQDESQQVATEIYTSFEWSHLGKPFRKLLLLPMMRSQKSSLLKGVFFTVDLSLYIWVYKSAGSLIAALSTLEKNQD